MQGFFFSPHWSEYFFCFLILDKHYFLTFPWLRVEAFRNFFKQVSSGVHLCFCISNQFPVSRVSSVRMAQGNTAVLKWKCNPSLISGLPQLDAGIFCFSSANCTTFTSASTCRASSTAVGLERGVISPYTRWEDAAPHFFRPSEPADRWLYLRTGTGFFCFFSCAQT